MNLSNTSRRQSQMMSLGMLLLAFAVFSWGVQYKLSLYNPPAKASARMAEAKLLSQKERASVANASESTLARAAQPILPVVFAYVASAMLIALGLFPSASSQSNVRSSAQLPKQPSQSFFFFRPPPVALPSN
jgi:hypothetical protein